jgi:oligopeptide/dipeptide ABC transporter ATP-binding protein
MTNDAMFRVDNLRLTFRTTRGIVQAVDNVSFKLAEGRTMVVVGESGCGKSSLSRAILRLLPKNVHEYRGSVMLGDTDVMALNDEDFRKSVRWVRIAMVPQAAMNALNPVIKIEEQVGEPLLVHGSVDDSKLAAEMARKMLGMVGVPLDFAGRYPFELSGGMRQRAAIAMALIAKPNLVVLDEPTSALDLLTQANIMNVLKMIKQDLKTTFILITHDIATSSELADDAAVMYAGQIVEKATAGQFFKDPLHPYSRKLMASVPTLRERKQLEFIVGQPPSLLNPPSCCRFAERCDKRFDKCSQEPPVISVRGGRIVKCWLYEKEAEHV